VSDNATIDRRLSTLETFAIQILLCLREFRQNCPSLLFRHNATSQQQGEVCLRPFVRRSSCSCEILWLNLFDIELANSFAHSL